MSDYIRREAAYKFFKDQLEEETGAYRKGRNAGLRVAMSAVMNNDAIPAADVRPVVLCKDCMYAPSGTDGGEDQGFSLEWPHDEWPEDNPCPCKCEDGWYSHKPKPDFFCANGKREES